MYLKETIVKAWGTAPANQEVKLIAEHGEVLIIEAQDGNRFSVKRDLVSSDEQETTIQESKEEPVKVQESARQIKSVRSKPISTPIPQQTTLF
ncbi:hypothetical protein QTN47_27205 [Danxiaibacter flavus]|uniref:Uncharacterized protein n=1 Tax=Danxiaibacter flavus TaxID=3049108 RepID=A0ABV3ZMW6_9BACT|nr:hypothetical protein QNM32_27205 [Chitinophagaceae bacterium DXS]